MNYKETLQYMYSALPMFHRIGSAAYKANLDNTIAICNLLKNPENKFKSIHIAGTNGKGSTSHMLASVLQSAGYKVGLYTSPHLKDFRERIKINSKMIPRKFVTDFISHHQSDFKRIQPSFFEMTVGLAFDYFAKQKVDIAVIEVGLGGRLDSTNVITPLVSVITNISYDHQNLLGDTLKKIAFEKAGIIKYKVPVVISETQGDDIKSVFMDQAKKNNTSIVFADKMYKTKKYKPENKNGRLYLSTDIYKASKLIYKGLRCELSGIYQLKNMPGVLMAVDILYSKGFKITHDDIRNGMLTIVSQTGLLGRWQVLAKRPLTIADTAHNAAGISEVLRQISLTSFKKLHIVFGMVNDKDVSGILKLLPKQAVYYFCKPSIPRGLDEKELQQQAQKFGLKGMSFQSVKKAFKTAQLAASKSDLVFVGGSTFVVAEVV